VTYVAEVRSPTVRRRELGALLRSFRLNQGLTVDRVAELLMCSPSKVSRMETGHRGVTARDIRDLCDIYGVADQSERDRLTTLAREGKQQAWWAPYDLNYSEYVGMETDALEMSVFQSMVIPGLLQTADYARAGHEGTFPRLSPEEIDRQIEAKMNRQRVLTRPDPPYLDVVLDEAALHRQTGGCAVMRAQLKHLIEVAKWPNITIQIVPFMIGAHPGVESNFKIVRLPAPSPDTVFVDGLIGSVFLDKLEDLERYRQVFARLKSIALSPKDSVGLIASFCTLPAAARALPQPVRAWGNPNLILP
jgi:transcriptional regulator with XRE-family HTH domain